MLDGRDTAFVRLSVVDSSNHDALLSGVTARVTWRVVSGECWVGWLVALVGGGCLLCVFCLVVHSFSCNWLAVARSIRSLPGKDGCVVSLLTRVVMQCACHHTHTGPGRLDGTSSGDSASHEWLKSPSVNVYLGLARGIVRVAADCTSASRDVAAAVDVDGIHGPTAVHANVRVPFVALGMPVRTTEIVVVCVGLSRCCGRTQPVLNE